MLDSFSMSHAQPDATADPSWLRAKNALVESVLDYGEEQSRGSALGNFFGSLKDHHDRCKADNRRVRGRVNEYKEELLRQIVSMGVPGARELSQHHYEWRATTRFLFNDAVIFNHHATLVGSWNMQFPERGSTGFRALEDRHATVGSTLAAMGDKREANVLRTIVGLRNLEVFRGDIDGCLTRGEWDLQKMMLGPCHYFGTIPTVGATSYRISVDHEVAAVQPEAWLPDVRYEALQQGTAQQVLQQQSDEASSKNSLPANAITEIRVIFSDLESPRTSLTENAQNSNIMEVLEVKSLSHDSQRNPLVLELNVVNATAFNLQPFGAQLVANEGPFAIPGIVLDEDDLQCITYWWGGEYAELTLREGDGIFLETHDFPQTITPLQEDAGGFVLLGRPRESYRKNGADRGAPITIDLVAVRIPYGHTLIVGKNAWHGDATLRGLHMMGMTANHLLMESTTKSWFLKTAAEGLFTCGMPSSGRLGRCHQNLHYEASYELYADGAALDNAPHAPYALQSLLSLNPVGWEAGEASQARIEAWLKQDQMIRNLPIWAAREYDLDSGHAERPSQDVRRLLTERFSESAVGLWDTRTLPPLAAVWPLRQPLEKAPSGAIVDGTIDGPEVVLYAMDGNSRSLGCISSRISVGEICHLGAVQIWGHDISKHTKVLKLVPPNKQPGSLTQVMTLETHMLLLDWFVPVDRRVDIMYIVVEAPPRGHVPYVRREPPRPQPAARGGSVLGSLFAAIK